MQHFIASPGVSDTIAYDQGVIVYAATGTFVGTWG
jgi:hypothetical protein